MIYLRCDVSETIGMGHLKRCLALAKHINLTTKTCFIIPAPSQNTINLIKEAGSSIHEIPANLSHDEEFTHYPNQCKNIIIDLGHRHNLDNPDSFVEYLNILDRNDCNIAIMDGLDDDAFRDNRAPRTTAYIQPYWGINEINPPNTDHWLRGPEYVLLDPIYKHSYQKRTSHKITKILITFGGADPQENTIKVLNSIKDLDSSLQIRVIIGAFFSQSHKEDIQALQSQAPDNIELIHAPDNLLEHYHWADLGICASSTSRYEAAACGLPIIFTAIYPEHKKLSQTFASYGTSLYIGYDQDLTPDDWQQAISRLQKTPQTYINMVNSIEKMQCVEHGTKHLSKTLQKIFQT